ncbi:hypothetical protein [Pseudodonghicola sp.]|uniref:hypothetical protein n=1 Tax=Pseudodonghicola sp. TaxID=1969463 RepID=UPI003A98353A
MHRKFIALVSGLAVAVALTAATTAPARADNDAAKVLAGIAALALIGAAIDSSNRPTVVERQVIVPRRPAYAYPRPVYAPPRPVYVQPRPVYVQPHPIYVQPRPIYTQPRPIYTQPQRNVYIQRNVDRNVYRNVDKHVRVYPHQQPGRQPHDNRR